MRTKTYDSDTRKRANQTHKALLGHLEAYICPYCGGTATAENSRIRVNHRQFCLRKQWMQQEFPLLMKMIAKDRAK